MEQFRVIAKAKDLKILGGEGKFPYCVNYEFTLQWLECKTQMKVMFGVTDNNILSKMFEQITVYEESTSSDCKLNCT